MPELAIIIPVYNSEKYLIKCLDSIKDQRISDFVTVIVDDGSTDGSGRICDEYSNEDRRFIVLHQGNRGSAAARNYGLKYLAEKWGGQKPRYLGFVDADDWIQPEMYEKMIMQAEAFCADVVACNYMIGGKTPEFDFPEVFLESNGEIIYEFIHQELCNRVTNKIYKYGITEDVFFPGEGRDLKEDAVWTTKVLLKAKKLVRIRDGLYNVRLSNDSMTRRRRKSEYALCGLWANDIEKYRLLCEANKKYIEEILPQLCGTLSEMLISYCDLDINCNYSNIRGLLCNDIELLLDKQAHKKHMDQNDYALKLAKEQNDYKKAACKYKAFMLISRNVKKEMKRHIISLILNEIATTKTSSRRRYVWWNE